MISLTASRSDYTGTGSVSSYDYDFRIISSGHLYVYVTDTDGTVYTLNINTDYSVSGVGEDDGGSITFINSSQSWLTGGNLKTGYKLALVRLIPLTQPSDFSNQSQYYPQSHELQFDKHTMVDQQQQDEIDRSPKLEPQFNPDNYDLLLAPVAGTLIGWNANATALTTYTIANLGGLTGDIDNTDDLAEGLTNLYYTNSRADARIALATLDNLSNVTVPTPSTGNKLTYNGSAWVNTNGLTTKGDLLTRSSSAEDRLGVGPDGWSLIPDSTASLGIKWARQPYAFRNVTSYDTADIDVDFALSDDVITLTGPTGYFTLTSFLGGASDGKILKLIHSGTLGQTYSIDPDGSEIYNTGASVIKLHHPGETYTLLADSNLGVWQVLNHYVPSKIESGAAWTDNQANATTSVEIFRYGKLVKIEGVSSFTGAQSGSFTITIPAEYTPSSRYIFTNTKRYTVGDARLVDAGTATFNGTLSLTALNTLQVNSQALGGAYVQDNTLTATLPFTWANNDSILFTGEWEVEDWTE